MNPVDSLVSGAIDMHVHFSPESLMERRQNALQLAHSAKEIGLRALVLKMREYNTVPLAMLVSELVPEVQVFGSLTLENEIGGLNPPAAISAARMGAKTIWMPTFSSSNSKSVVERVLGFKLPGKEQSILNPNGKLKAEVKEILQIVMQFNIVLASGHISPKETFALAEEAQRIGFTKLVVTHALQGALTSVLCSRDELKQLAQSGVYIEHSFWDVLPTMNAYDPVRIVELVKDIGAEHSIMSTDLGQSYNPPAPEGMRLFIATMLRKGLTANQVELMVKTNPAKLLGLT
ncbi:MAG TPA: DUF6282 family protein [Dehalococcoidales bacterium]